jgi:hypothetical protein
MQQAEEGPLRKCWPLLFDGSKVDSINNQIGINYIGQENALRGTESDVVPFTCFVESAGLLGCINDARNVRKFLIGN